MVAKKGFTLIELLIVVTILSVLAGAAVPYVQDYLEDSRIARAKTDLEEIKGALQRYELTRGISYNNTSIASLVGPFLSRALTDPWGAPYAVATGGSVVLSLGPDGKAGGGDDVAAEFRPRMAISQAFWVDVNQNGTVDSGDCLNLKATRPIGGTPNGTVGTDFAITGAAAPTSYGAPNKINGNRIASYPLTITSGGFTPGSDTITIKSATNLTDGSGTAAIVDTLTIISR